MSKACVQQEHTHQCTRVGAHTHTHSPGVKPPSWHHKRHNHTMLTVPLKTQGAERPQRAFVKVIRQSLRFILKVTWKAKTKQGLSLPLGTEIL